MVDRGDPVSSSGGLPDLGPGATPPASPGVRTNCPQCAADLVVLRIIPGRAGDEYWTQRCERCSSIHLDIVKGYR